jgi:hypothetical protein
MSMRSKRLRGFSPSSDDQAILAVDEDQFTLLTITEPDPLPLRGMGSTT